MSREAGSEIRSERARRHVLRPTASNTDIYVANDMVRNFLYRNNGTRFRDVTYAAGVGFDGSSKPQAGMASVRNVDANGGTRYFVWNFRNEQLCATGPALFEDSPPKSAGVQASSRWASAQSSSISTTTATSIFT